VLDATNGGAHLSVDAIGDARAAAASVRSLRRRGRHVQVGLLHGGEVMTALPMDRVIAFELQVHGSHGMAAHEYPAMLALVVSGALRPDLLVGAVIGLDDAADALTAMDRNAGGGMTVIRP
jgi:alcohol dehydrogenase